MANGNPVEHYDGEPNQSYEEDIRRYMQRMYSGWDHKSNEENFLQDWSITRAEDFSRKFPFAMHRFNDNCYTKKDWEVAVVPGAVRNRNTPAEPSRPPRTGGFVVSGANIRTRSDPKTSAEDIQLAKVIIYYLV